MSEYISRDEAYQRLRDAGGCGATDEWDKGYDEAIGVALDIIEGGTRCRCGTRGSLFRL